MAKKDETISEETIIAQQIMHKFRYIYKEAWVQQDQLMGQSKSRLWVKVFNDLIKMKMIKRRKTGMGYQYKWAAKFPY